MFYQELEGVLVMKGKGLIPYKPLEPRERKPRPPNKAY